VWETARGKKVRTIPAHAEPVYALAFRHDGVLASGGDDRTIKLWDATGKELAVYHGHRGSVRVLLFARDGTLYSAGCDQTLRWWLAQNGTR
jgi:WD40 repeat protein